MNRKLSSLIAAAIFALAGAPALAIDSVAVEGGSGDSTDMGRVAIQWDWNQHWFQGKDWHLGGYWDLGIGHWRRSSTLPGQNEDITEIGLTPVFRLQQNSLTGPYFEAAIGFHVMSRTRIGDKRMGTLFQFGDHLGAGYRFGAKSAFDLSYRFQHLSNANIKKPNNGINFHQIRLQYHF